MIAIAVVVIVFVLGGAQLLRGETWMNVFMLAVALAVSAIPAGLPVAITVALSIGSKRMARRHVIVRRLPAVEGLGACTVIASDKTGTLTQNKLAVQRLRPIGAEAIEVTGAPDQLQGSFERDGHELDPQTEAWLRDLVIAGALCNEAEIRRTDEGLQTRGDTVDIALLVMAAKAGLYRDDLLSDHPEIGSIPFESQKRFAATFNRHEGKLVAHVKGAAEKLKRRPRRPDERIFNRQMIEEVLLTGVYMGVVGFGVFFYLASVLGLPMAEARNDLLLLLVLFQNVHALNVRSETRSIFRIPLSANWLLIGAIGLAQAVHIVSMYIPGWRDVLGVQPVTGAWWAALLGIALTLVLVVEAYKWLRGRTFAQRLYAKPENPRAAVSRTPLRTRPV